MSYELRFLGIGDAGVYGKALDYDISIPDYRLNNYYHYLIEGGVVMDKRPIIESDEFVGFVFRSPILKVSLGENMLSKCFEDTRRFVEGDVLTDFDYVSTDLYLKYWRPKGVRIGFRRGNRIEWEDGKVEDIDEKVDLP